MEARLRQVEDAVTRIEATLPHLATKADVADLKASMAELKVDAAESVTTMVKWFVGTAFAMVGLASAISFGVARLL